MRDEMPDEVLAGFVERVESGDVAGVVAHLISAAPEDWGNGCNWDWKEANGERFDKFIQTVLAASGAKLSPELVSELLGHYETVLVDQPDATDRGLVMFGRYLAARVDEITEYVTVNMVDVSKSPDASWPTADLEEIARDSAKLSKRLSQRPTAN
ncbi:hypothetical protein [Dermatophilus congolensis]|uniref:hypothetical protein n=1 Tax=Dermatophilus congolensis TaxID=1863 RepID=UPI001AAFD525|nr:hypothetical protein [Dermatophilus congolensis]MBO3129922.1 hypothetical protein [Dermatophilus congolensis]MBO3131448.1 hypothetical protein [Dermatophilus congolensis]MBO3134396.1 hypothetical protein [Dermatophilus congolensis]MBO3136631.1 hypothetical protein [Dermatophilus congolensis]MBO3138875.1 hypothetical protein [Dermatophilus congolensis]